MSVIKRLNEASKKIKAIPMANMQRFKARHIYDVYNVLQPILAETGLVVGRKLLNETIHEVTSKTGAKGWHRYQVWEFEFRSIDEPNDVFSTVFCGESIDYGDKSASQCDASAFKQMLLHTFLIPTKDLGDPDDKPAANAADDFAKEITKKVSQAQIKRLYAIQGESTIGPDQIKTFMKQEFGIDSSKDLAPGQYDRLIRYLQDNKK